jgi:hypothetical protein
MPQLSALVFVSTHRPLQKVCPVGHELLDTHLPPTHAGVLPPHTVPHPPQLCGSFAVSMQPPLQLVVLAGQVAAHAPFAHTRLAPHGLPHCPQFCGSAVVSTQPPLQLAVYGGHVPTQPLNAHTIPAGHG